MNKLPDRLAFALMLAVSAGFLVMSAAFWQGILVALGPLLCWEMFRSPKGPY